jgi:hypothetical protein
MRSRAGGLGLEAGCRSPSEAIIGPCLPATGGYPIGQVFRGSGIAELHLPVGVEVAYIWLTPAAGVLALLNIGLYFGVQEWTARVTGGVVDARFIAIIDTTLDLRWGRSL